MTQIDLGAAVDLALEQAMAADDTIVVFGEDVPMVRRNLLMRFGPARVRGTPISESAFLGAGVGAALGGLRPVVEMMFVDFLGVALNALSNEATLVETLSGGRWHVPMLVRATCGGGYGDAGQHEHASWGMLSSIPGLVVAVPATPADAAGLAATALRHDGPVLLLEHKLMSEPWRSWVVGSPAARARLPIPAADPVTVVEPVPFGSAALRAEGSDVLLVSVGLSVHRSLDAAAVLASEQVSVGVLDLRTTAPLDTDGILSAARTARAVLVVDEDYGPFGLSAEVLAVLAEHGVHLPCGRLAATGPIPYARTLEDAVLPSVGAIVDAARKLVSRA